MTLTPAMVRAYQKERVERVLMTRLGFSIPIRRVPDEDDAGVPTAYGQVERNYYNDLLDDIGTRDVLGVIR